MKSICNISDLISIWADDRQYIVRRQTNKKQNSKHADSAYFPTLEACFQEVFEILCRERLADGKKKTLKEVVEIIRATRQEIREIMQPFVNLGYAIEGRQTPAEGGK